MHQSLFLPVGEPHHAKAVGARRWILRVICLGAFYTCTPAAWNIVRAAEAAEQADPDVERIQTARQLFAEGKDAMDQEEWSRAAGHFREAARIKDTPGLRYHVAFCEENAGHLREARLQYEAARELLASQPAPDVEELLGPALARLEEKLPQVRLTWTTPEEPRRVLVNGEPRADWYPGQVLYVDPGEHDIYVEVPGYEPFEARLVLTEGQRHALTVQANRSRTSSTPGVQAEKPASGWHVPALVTGAALSTIGIGAGVWGLLDRAAAGREMDWARRGMAQYSEADDRCRDASGGLQLACDDFENARRRQGRSTTIAVAGFATLGVGAAVTVTTLLLWPDSPLEVSASVGDTTGLRLRGFF